MAPGQILDFHYDISCPFAYIASTKVEALAKRTRCTLNWRPVLLGAIYRATNAPQGAAGSASNVFNATKKAVTGRAFQRTIKRHGIPYREPPQHPTKTVAALRLLYFLGEGEERVRVTHALYRAYWVEGRDVSAKSTLAQIVRECGVSDVERVVGAIESGAFEGPEQRRQLEEATDLALKRGAFGVPAFWIPAEVWTDGKGVKRQGRLYWGQDRMHFVEAVLLALNEGLNGDSMGRMSKPIRGLLPRCTRSGIPAGDEVKMEFWYDFSSPWAFLGWTQLASMKRRFGLDLHIEMKPFLLGILFREIGAPNLPMAAVSEPKRLYSQQDHASWVRWWNSINQQEGRPEAPIAFYWADQFPIRTPTVLRAVLVEPRLVDVLFRACWERNMDMSSDSVLETVIAEAGYDAKRIMEGANSKEVKAELRGRTREAIEQGICGVPTYRVFRRKKGGSEGEWRQAGDIVWGQDELGVVEDMIAGWDGEGIARVEDDMQSRL